MTDHPRGIVAVLISDGRVIASASVFETSVPGGFTLLEAQQMRARRALAMEVMRALASPLLADSIDLYTAESILSAMCNKGCRMSLVPIGHAG